MKTTQEKYNWKLQTILSAFVFFTIYVINFILNPYVYAWTGLFELNEFELGLDLLLNILFSWLIIRMSILIAACLERFLAWIRFPLLRFLLQTMLILCSTMLLIYLQSQIYEWIFGDMTLTQQEILATWQFLVVIVIVSLFVSGIHTGYFLLIRWKDSMQKYKDLEIKSMELKEVAMQSELQSLKMQLDPHFMFNNFSVLSELINEDKQAAICFLDNLSRIHRYMSQNLKKNIVSLRNEITFVKSYCYMIHVRHGDNIQVIFDVNKDLLDLYIPPVSLRLLIENAIEHNVATINQPLIITITAKNKQEIKVCNNLQRFTGASRLTGVGLKNIIEQYRLLSEEYLPVIKETSDCFCVILPLLKNP